MEGSGSGIVSLFGAILRYGDQMGSCQLCTGALAQPSWQGQVQPYSSAMILAAAKAVVRTAKMAAPTTAKISSVDLYRLAHFLHV